MLRRARNVASIVLGVPLPSMTDAGTQGGTQGQRKASRLPHRQVVGFPPPWRTRKSVTYERRNSQPKKLWTGDLTPASGHTGIDLRAILVHWRPPPKKTNSNIASHPSLLTADSLFLGPCESDWSLTVCYLREKLGLKHHYSTRHSYSAPSLVRDAGECRPNLPVIVCLSERDCQALMCMVPDWDPLWGRYIFKFKCGLRLNPGKL